MFYLKKLLSSFCSVFWELRMHTPRPYNLYGLGILHYYCWRIPLNIKNIIHCFLIFYKCTLWWNSLNAAYTLLLPVNFPPVNIWILLFFPPFFCKPKVTLSYHDIKNASSLCFCNLQCDFLVPVLKKSQLSPPKKDEKIS